MALGTGNGFGIYDLNSYARCYHERTGGRTVVAPVFTSSLVALVGSGDYNGSSSMRTLQLFNMATRSCISEIHFPTPILSVLVNHDRVAVVLEHMVQLLELPSLKTLAKFETEPNPRGLCALTAAPGQAYMALPKGQNAGTVMLYDATNGILLQELHAHKGTLTALCFDHSGTMLATASETGTIVRVFRVPDGSELHQFRRGSTPAQVSCLAFSSEEAAEDIPGGPVPSQFLACSSNTSTVHVFKLLAPATREEDEKGFVSSMLPAVLSDVWDPLRHFAFVSLQAPLRSVCALRYRGAGVMRLLLLTETGTFFEYEVDLLRGGECKGPKRATDVLRDVPNGAHHGGVELVDRL